MNTSTFSSSCPLCSRMGSGPLAPHSDFSESSLYLCSECSHFYCWPEPTPEAVGKYYQTAYGAQRKTYLFSIEYRNIMVRRAAAQLAYIQQHAHPGAALDVGCGIGALTAALNESGWTARGIDGDSHAIEYGKRLFTTNLTTTPLIQIARESSEFDLVCLSHVVEHMIDVRRTLVETARLLRPGGHIFIEVPNITHLPHGDLESHINFFSRSSLTHLIEFADLEILRCQCCGPVRKTHKPTQSEHPLTTLAYRVGKRLTKRFLNKTDWDGWYDKYYDDDRGIWIRCLCSRKE